MALKNGTCLLGLAAVCLLLSSAACQNVADRDFLNAVNNMVGGDVSTGNLIGTVTSSASWGSKDEATSNLRGLVDLCINIPIRIIFTTFNIQIYPYKRLTPLLYCSACRISSLTFGINIAGTSGSVTANALMAVKGPSVVTVRQASGTASTNINQQYISVAGKSVTRGLYAHELDAVQNKLQRESSLAMKREISAKTGLYSEAALSSLYLDESNKLRNLYAQIEYDYTELDRIEPANLANTIVGASLGLITDGGIVSRVHSIAQGSSRSSFMYAVNDTTFFVGAVTNFGSYYLLRFSTFRVQGKLPTGAFATSVGSWYVERYGSGATPSLAQILAIFPAIKA